MAAGSNVAQQTDERVLVITRTFDAPRQLVWNVWTEPDRMVHWLGPQGFSGSILKMDARPGGAYHFHMRGPAGDEHWVQGVYREIVEYQRLVYTWAWADGKGNATRPETLVTVTFEDLGDKTRLTLHQAMFESESARDEHRGGWNSCFDRLAEYLATA